MSNVVDIIDELMMAVDCYQYSLTQNADAIFTETTLSQMKKRNKKWIRDLLRKLTGDEFSAACELLQETFGDYTQFM